MRRGVWVFLFWEGGYNKDGFINFEIDFVSFRATQRLDDTPRHKYITSLQHHAKLSHSFFFGRFCTDIQLINCHYKRNHRYDKMIKVFFRFRFEWVSVCNILSSILKFLIFDGKCVCTVWLSKTFYLALQKLAELHQLN